MQFSTEGSCEWCEPLKAQLRELQATVKQLESKIAELKGGRILFIGSDKLVSQVPISVLSQMLHHLPREALLRLRLASHGVCNRVLALIADERLSHGLHFQRRLRMPANLDGVVDLAPLRASRRA